LVIIRSASSLSCVISKYDFHKFAYHCKSGSMLDTNLKVSVQGIKNVFMDIMPHKGKGGYKKYGVLIDILFLDLLSTINNFGSLQSL